MNNDRDPALGPFNRISIPSTTLSVSVFASLVTLSALACILGTFYDDEIFNIRRAAHPFVSLVDFVNFLNSTDIHPPASYLLNKLTFEVLGNWKAVQLVNGTLNAAAIAWFHFWMLGKVGERERFLLTFALATAVTSQLWGTGLRWNAYFNPIFLVLFTVAMSKRPSVVARASFLAVGTVLLFHISYLTVVAGAVLWAVFFTTSFSELRQTRPLWLTLILPPLLFVVCRKVTHCWRSICPGTKEH